MKCLLVAINAKYIHSNLAVYTLKACAEKAFAESSAELTVELGEYTINHHASEIFDAIYEQKADVVCFSCYIWNIEYVRTLVRNLKKLRPQLKIWLGGPEVSYRSEEFLEELPEADGILYGEGERSFPALLSWLINTEENAEENAKQNAEQSAEQSGEHPVGAVYRETKADGTSRLVRTPPAPFADLDDIPFVYRNLSAFDNKILYYETSRGCPFSCSYCLSSVDKKLRFKSLPQVFEELQFFLDKKVKQVKFVDRTFNCKKSHAMPIWTYLRDHDNGVTNFHFEIAADILTEDEIALIGTLRPGLIQLEIGVQSANMDTICAIHRKMDLDRVGRVTEQIRRGHNVHQHLDLIAGLPWEDYESFGHSYDVVYGMKPSQLQLGFLKVLKGAAMYEDARRFHMIYQTEAPFEILETPWLPHDDVIRLKLVEEMTEVYYNSGQFTMTLAEAEKFFPRPFLLFEALGKRYRALGLDRKKHVRAARYEFFLDYIREVLPEQTEAFRSLLTFDYYLRENARKRPAFAAEETETKELCREALKRYRPDMPLKNLQEKYHVEAAVSPETGERSLWLFDYGNPDVLTGNASLIRLETEDKGETQ